MATKELLFEIGTEELPAGFITPALIELEKLLKNGLKKAGLEFASTRTLGTPRRLVLVVEGLSTNKPASSVEVRGPKKEAAFDANGKPTRALVGFAKGQGVKIEDIEVRGEGSSAHVYARKKIKGEDTIDLLPQLLRSLISANLFPKTMRWGARDVSFARPIHWIVALFGADIVDFDYSGIRSSNSTFGHRFMAKKDKEPGSMIVVDGFSGYVQVLKDAYVIVDPEERRKIIEEGLKKAAKEIEGAVLPDPALVEEVVNLVEYPVVIRGGFDKEFLTLPSEVVINAMREHQRYFSVTDKDGKLLNSFITVANIKAKDARVVINGNERVLRARLNDAKFYYELDLKVKLDDWVERLKDVVFQAKLGTSFEKVERFTKLSELIGIEVKYKDVETLKRAAFLCKADLVSGMVGEFPKLQGIMGRVYAELAGEPKAVSEAIYEHYMPTSAGGDLPATEAGAIISIADKMDTIAGCFGVGLVPTGAKDPYALRRAALGIISILIEKKINLLLDELIGLAFDGLKDKLTRELSEATRDVVEFFKERLKNKLLSEGFSFDAIDAVLSTDWMGSLVDTVARVRALEAFKKDPDCERLVIAFKRVSNILKKAKCTSGVLFPELFTEEEEKELYEIREKIAPQILACVRAQDYEGAFKKLTSIKDVIDAFFDEVMVMVEDKEVKENRLALLHSIRELYFNIADLSKLQSLE